MNRREKLSFSLAIIINIIIVILIPQYKIQDVVDKEIKIGLVAIGDEKVTQKKKQQRVEKSTEKKAEKKSENKITKAKKKNFSLSSISKTIEAPDFVNLKSVKEKQRKQNETDVLDSIKTVKKEIKFEHEKKLGLNTKEIEFSDTLKDEDIGKVKDDKLFIDEKKSLSDSLKIDNTQVEGLPSGYKLGVEDGDVIASWDKLNQEPVYPETAELRGLQGTVRVKIDVNERGDVTNLVMVKGSGVPEINSAIESIGRTWKIYLSKHGLSIKGRVILDYTFKLKGGE